jgi:hypothetical protein
MSRNIIFVLMYHCHKLLDLDQFFFPSWIKRPEYEAGHFHLMQWVRMRGVMAPLPIHTHNVMFNETWGQLSFKSLLCYLH